MPLSGQHYQISGMHHISVFGFCFLACADTPTSMHIRTPIFLIFFYDFAVCTQVLSTVYLLNASSSGFEVTFFILKKKRTENYARP